MNNLEIKQEARGEEIHLICTGRLDANHAGHLNDYIDRLVREGHYYISLDMSGIEYLSSAGIRLLVTRYKSLKAINGSFYIETMSDNVKQVLNMVGMITMLGEVPTKAEAPAATIRTSADHLDLFGFHFGLTPLSSEGKTDVRLYGKPELAIQSAFEAHHARRIHAEENHFAIGLGAIGDSFDECKKRFGEFVMIGKNIAYLPADGSKKPDYMVSSGQLVASLTELYGLHFEGNFSGLVRFDTEEIQTTIGTSQLVEAIEKLTGYSQFAMVMIAESSGLVGTSLNTSPVGGKKIFSFPEVKDAVNFTTEPAYNKMLTLSVGIVSSEKTQEAERFLRPLKPGATASGHLHSTVFPYVPLKKTNIDLNETIDYLLNSMELIDILHLTNDTREITGLGESQFVHGFCWVVPVGSTNVISTQ